MVMRVLLVRFLWVILLPLLAVMFYFRDALEMGLPLVDGQITVAGIDKPITLERSEQGVVFVSAEDDQAVFFGIGFAHAQDRLWQLELQRRMAKGQLSEVFGAQSVNIDAQMRTYGLYRSAESAWEGLSPEAKASLQAYSAGINAWLESTTSLPIEFGLLDVKPKPWQAIDSLAWSKVFALNLSNSLFAEISRYMAWPYLDEQKRQEFFATYPQNTPVTAAGPLRRSMVELVRLNQKLEQQLSVGGRFVGSNAWVVAGQLTDTGHGILANDPHLAIQVPSLWYMANLRGDKLDVAGMTIVGLPVVIFGHNGNIAWGGTNMMADTQDLYFEQVNSADPNLYLDNGQWLAFKTRKERIHVRPDFPEFLKPANKPVEITVRETVRGPVINDVFGLGGQPISMQWTALTPQDTTYESFFGLNYAHDWQSFKTSLSHHVAPALNFLYADKQGNIGYLGVGKIPIRAKGRGDLPVNGGSGDYYWRGYIEFEQWPQSYNPEKGFIVSANNQVVADDYPFHISSDWAPGYRAARIEQLLQQSVDAQQPLSVDMMQNLQGDTWSFGADALLQKFKSLSFIGASTGALADEKRQQALDRLQDWQGDMTADSQAASIFYAWVRHLRKVLLLDDLKVPYGREYEAPLLERLVDNITYHQLVAALEPGGANWCDDVTTLDTEDCLWAMTKALDGAIKELSKLKGSDMDDWAWGEMHQTVYRHQPFSEVNFIKPWFERKINNGGGPNTVNVADGVFVESEGYEQHFGAGFRQVIGFSSTGVIHRYINSTGQSGNVMSQHYDDMITPFNQLKFFDNDKGEALYQLRLIPAATE